MATRPTAGFSVATLGCKANQYDGRAIASALVGLGLRPAAIGSGPALVVVNTCCVTAAAMRKSRQAIRRAIRGAPGSAILVAGCYADYDPDGIGRLLASLGAEPGRAFLAGHHGDLPACLERLAGILSLAEDRAGNTSFSQEGKPAVSGGGDLSMTTDHIACQTALPSTIKARRAKAVKLNAPGLRHLPPIDRFDGHQRAFVKVQDGCDAFCSYCVVPYIRWRVWSRPLEQIEAECRNLVRAGHREIVLSGIFLGAFGRQTAIRRRWKKTPSPLAELVGRVASIEGLWRVRLSSLEPMDLTEDLLETCAGLPNFAPHFHLPLQSGSDAVLARMNRRYTAGQYRRAVDRLRRAFDRPAVTADVIVGFPGEGPDDFAATLAAARGAGFAKIHAFPFSPIEGTAAWNWRSEMPPAETIKRRMAELAALERELADAYRRQFLGQAMEGLVERPAPRSGGALEAMTDRYVSVFFPRPARNAPAPGSVVRLHAEGLCRKGLTARLLSP